MMVPSQLAREAERERFRLLHGLGGQPERLEGLLRELEVRVPHHPVARTARGWAALPETALPAPPENLAAAAQAWLDGDLAGAREAAATARAELDHPRTTVTLGDLAWQAGEATLAVRHWRVARGVLGALPPLEVRLGRAAFARQRHGEALDHAARALVENPLYGTAAVLLGHVCIAGGGSPIPVPLPPQVRQIDGQLQLSRGLGPRARRVWLRALEAARTAPPDELPPGQTAALTLVATWRELPSDGRRADRAEWPLRQLDAWEREGLLDVYLWAVGLDAGNAEAWRGWRQQHTDAVRRFWSEGTRSEKR